MKKLATRLERRIADGLAAVLLKRNRLRAVDPATLAILKRELQAFDATQWKWKR